MLINLKKKKKLFLVIILVIAGLVLLQRLNTSVNVSSGPGEVFVKRVVDGDTIETSGGVFIRYIGIDTPETRRRVGSEFVWDPKPYAEEAAEFNRQLVEKKRVRLEYDIERYDKYKRTLAYVFVDDTFVNAELVKAGLGLVYTFPPNVKYTDELIVLQQKARLAGRGMWQGMKGEVLSPEQAGSFIGEIKIVEGRILSTYKSPKVTFLNFGEDYKTDFTAVIFNNNLASFARKGIDPVRDYRGKQVRVYGRIKEYGGPEIVLDNPGQIEIVE